MVIASAAFVTRALDLTILLELSASRHLLANLLIIPGPLFCFDCLSAMVVSIISSWSGRLPSSETLSSTVVLFLLRCEKRVSYSPGFDQKVQNLLLPISILI